MKVLITGASQGMGKSTVLKFLRQGHEVHGMDIKPAGIIFGPDDNYQHHMVDISEKVNLPDIDLFDIVINSAGVADDLNSIKVNLLGSMNVCEKYAMQPNIKSVVNIVSVSAHNGAEYPYYTASKGGFLAYTKWLAQELAVYGTTVNSISPGGVITDMTRHIWEDARKRKLVLDETLLNKWASPDEIADWVYFISVVNSSMTAQDIIIDNGETAKYNFIQ